MALGDVPVNFKELAPSLVTRSVLTAVLASQAGFTESETTFTQEVFQLLVLFFLIAMAWSVLRTLIFKYIYGFK